MDFIIDTDRCRDLTVMRIPWSLHFRFTDFAIVPAVGNIRPEIRFPPKVTFAFSATAIGEERTTSVGRQMMSADLKIDVPRIILHSSTNKKAV
jgi:hypothetical protein